MQPDKVTLYYRDGTSDKLYAIEIRPAGADRFDVYAIYGRRGGTMKTDRKTIGPMPRHEAQQVFDQLSKEKRAKGYQEGSPMGEVQIPPSETKRSTGFSLMLLNEVDMDQAYMLIESDEWVMQPKWDGVRCLLTIEP